MNITKNPLLAHFSAAVVSGLIISRVVFHDDLSMSEAVQTCLGIGILPALSIWPCSVSD